LTTREGLAAWWTNNTQGKAKSAKCSNTALAAGGFDMKVLEHHPAQRVLWQVVDGPKAWIGFRIHLCNLLDLVLCACLTA
jgi:hypothetical protein